MTSESPEGAPGRRPAVPVALDAADTRAVDTTTSSTHGEAGGVACALPVADWAPVGLAVVSAAGRLLHANPALAEILGCADVDELLATPLGAFHKFPELAVEIILEHLEQGSVAALELDLVRRDGAEITVRLNANVQYGPSGEAVVVGTVEDITSHKEAQRESTHSQKMEAVARFAAGVAHDYNNLLTAIIGESRDLLANLPEDSEAHESARAILRAAKRAGTITRRLLVFSKSEVARTEVVELNDLVAAQRDALAGRIGRDVELVWRLDPAAGRVRMDPSHVEQILRNLVGNARDALPAGGRIVVETGRVVAPEDTDGLDFHPPVAPGEYASLAVGDNGIGMNQETRRRMFDPFFTTKPIGGGAGLGLTTVYGLVLRAGGHISVISAPAYGTLVRILLPPTAEEPTAAGSARAAAGPKAEGPRTILVVDDEDPVRRVMRKVLAHQGYDVLEAPDAFAAQEVVRNHAGPIDLMVTDVMMPRMKGTELAQWLAAERPGTPVLLVSGYTDSPVIQEWVDQDPDVFLAKPFEPEELLERVSKRLEAA